MRQFGKLDQPITIKELSTTSDAIGATIETYTAIENSPKWAEYIPLTSKERLHADKVETKVDFRLKIRRDIRVTASCQITHGTKTYRVYGGPSDYHREG